MKPMSKKVDLAEKLQEEFEKLVAEKENKKYKDYISKVTKDLIEKEPKNKKEAEDIARNYSVDTDVSVKMFNLLNGVTNKLLNDDTEMSRKKLKPLDPLLRVYNVNNPKTFAKEMYQITTNKKASKRNKRFRPLLLSYYSGFTENIESEKQQAERALRRANVESQSAIFKELEKAREEKIPIRKLKKQLIKKYNDPKRVQRALNTELHEQAERVKLEQSKFLGFKYKKWNTQKDERVRRTRFHNQVSGKTVKIGEDFEAAGLKADFPGSLSLPVGERINCRCFVTYHNGKNAKISPKPIVEPNRKTIEEPIGSRAIQGSNLLNEYSNDAQELRKEIKNTKKTNIKRIIKDQNYDKPPQKVKRKRFQKQVEKNNLVISRGYWGKDKETAKKFRKEMESGEFFVDNVGGAAHGRGMYFAGGNPKSFKFRFSQKTVQFYSKGAFNQEQVKSDDQRVIDIATVTDDFKFIESKKVDEEFENFLIDKLFTDKSDDAVNDDLEVLDNLNPTGSVFVDYDPEYRARAPLASNMTTLDKTMGRKGNEKITIYRGTVPEQDEIRAGDFVTTNYELARSYTGQGETFNILTEEVRLDEILDDLDEPLGEEYIYRPKRPQGTRQQLDKYLEQKKKVEQSRLNISKSDSDEDYERKRDIFTEESENLNMVRLSLDPDVREKIDVIEEILDEPDLDHGTQAAMMGYDGIKNKSTHIILNRSKIIMLDNDGDPNDTYIQDIIQGKRI